MYIAAEALNTCTCGHVHKYCIGQRRYVGISVVINKIDLCIMQQNLENCNYIPVLYNYITELFREVSMNIQLLL